MVRQAHHERREAQRETEAGYFLIDNRPAAEKC